MLKNCSNRPYPCSGQCRACYGGNACPASAETKPVYSTAETTIGVLLEDAAAKAILDKHIPGLTDNPSISMAAGMTLKALQGMAGDKSPTKCWLPLMRF